MSDENQKGFSLVETVVYIGLLAIILPFIFGFFISLTEQSNSIDPRVRMQQKASVLFSLMNYEITSSESIDITNSTLETDTSTFIFVDDNGDTVTIDSPQEVIDFTGNSQTVQRIRLQRGVSSAVYLTDEDINVTKWNIQPVRDSGGILSGMNIEMTFRMLEPTGVYRGTSFDSETTISLQPQTAEL